jgi:hypothetical protein
VRKIYINENDDYRIEAKPGVFVGPGRTAQIFGKDEDLEGQVNPIIIDNLVNAEVVEYVPYVPTLQEKKIEKIIYFKGKKDNGFEYDGELFQTSDVIKFTPLLNYSDTEMESFLPLQVTPNYIFTTAVKVKGLQNAYLLHLKKYGKKVIDASIAETEQELDEILDD